MNSSLIHKFFIGLLFLTFISCEEILMEKDISNREVVLVAPMNNAQFYSTGVTFFWETVADATEYQLQIATPNFANPLQIIVDTKIKENSFTQQLPVGNYEWRVRAINSGYSTDYSSRLVSVVSNADFQNNIVVLNTPANNLITKKTVQNLSWGAIIGATGYQVQIYDGNNTIVKDETVTTTNLNYTFTEGNFFWKVRATNGTQQTLYTSRSALVDTTVPNIPVLSSPANTSTTANTNVSFQWSRTSITGSVEKDSIFIYTDAALTVSKLKKEAVTPFSTTLDSGTYYWYTKSFDEAGNSGTKSSVFSFTVN
ncbi:hypothetical protein [Flavobacterium eburneipallidum]|uniref:hypothetical protein n=1 Tax=Flavobacterium eburneipallidum TaxID=3003263 RepID=UPI0024825468|nr:hypothetical protein [Flavobacterium eburneipallidum]